MRKWSNGIDNKTNEPIIYSECSLNEVGFELEVNGIEVLEVTYETDGSCLIVTDKGDFFYDESRRMLLKYN